VVRYPKCVKKSQECCPCPMGKGKEEQAAFELVRLDPPPSSEDTCRSIRVLLTEKAFSIDGCWFRLPIRQYRMLDVRSALGYYFTSCKLSCELFASVRMLPVFCFTESTAF
jgi:hypothetical protein